MDVIKIQIDTNAQDAGKTFDDLSNKMRNTDKATTDLRKQIKGLKDELYQLTPGTEEYANVLEQLGGKMDQLQETTQQVRAATGGLDTVFQTTTSATASMASGFTAATGVIALFGGDAEDLQKTFVKLQAVMSIMNGLKGFSGFTKESKKASISLRTFSNTSRETTQSLNVQKTATQELTVSETTATTATLSLRGAIQSVTAAIAANPIGAVLVAITAAITAITHFAGAAKEAREQTKQYNEVLAESRNQHRSFVEQLEDANDKTERRIARLKALGASEEEINKILKKSNEAMASQLRHKKDILEANIELHKSNTKMKDSLEKWAAELDEVNAKLKETQKTLDGMADTKLPDFVSQFNTSFASLDKSLSRQVTAGIITESQKIRAEINAYNKEIESLQQTLAGTKKKRDLPANSPSMNTELDAIITDITVTITRYKQAVKDLEESLKDQGAKAVKTSRDEYTKLSDTMSKEFLKLKEQMEKELDIYSTLEQTIGKDKAQARMSGVINSWRYGFNSMITSILEEAKKSGKLLDSDMNKLLSDFTKYQEKYYEILHDKNFDFAGWPPGIELMEIRLKNLSNDFTKMNNILLGQLKEGTITTEEYNNWLTKATEKFISDREAMVDEADKTIKQTLANMNISEEEKKALEAQWRELFNFSVELLPPEDAKKITDSLWNALKQGLDKTDADFGRILDKIQTDAELATNAWIRGKGDAGIISTILFGAGQSPTKMYEEAQKQAQNTYSLLYQQYTKEIEMATNKAEIMKALYGEESEEYKKFADEIIRLQNLLAQAQINFENKQVENAETYADKIKGIASGTFDALGGLASAMGSYYGEQKEQAKKLYGENSEEYQKYLKKEGAMKIAEVWANWATGVMAAWAANAKYGVASYILAALQTAALTATAIASTQQINRSTKANSSGGGSTANVSGLTDRVIMGQVQDTDQTAQLNAGYNQGAQRVFVTVDDINSGQDANRTAVTNNQF